ncbi:MAG: energy-coupling factor ABC transporter permease [Pseudomonadota bacterium]
MSIDTSLIPGWMHLASSLLLAVGMMIALRFAEWRALTAVPGRIHLLSLAVLFCLGLWSLSAPVGDSLQLHLLGMTSVTLLLGWRFAMLCGSLALLALLLLQGQTLSALPVSCLLTVVIPASVSRFVLHLLPRQQNLFFYTLGGGFIGGMTSALCVAIATGGLLALAGHAELVQRAAESWPVLVLVLFPEGFINGMLVTAGCVFFPDAVKTFDDHFYLAANEGAESRD